MQIKTDFILSRILRLLEEPYKHYKIILSDLEWCSHRQLLYTEDETLIYNSLFASLYTEYEVLDLINHLLTTKKFSATQVGFMYGQALLRYPSYLKQALDNEDIYKIKLNHLYVLIEQIVLSGVVLGPEVLNLQVFEDFMPELWKQIKRQNTRNFKDQLNDTTNP